MRQKLAEGHPVIVAMRTTDAILDNLPAGEIYSEHAAGDPAREHGRHALVLVGYDNEKQAFRLMNSWGPDWSDHGYGWISYPSARSEIEEAFSIVSDRPPPTPVPAPAHKPDGPDVGVLACSDLSVVRSPAGYRLQGFVENEADRANVLAVLSADLATLRVSGRPVRAGQIDVRPWPQCEALLALAAPLAAADRPVLRTLDGRTALAIGDRFGFELQAPNYPAFLYLIYLQADGQAVNLLPRRGPVREQVAPRAVLRIGDPARPGPKFTALGADRREVVIAVASRSPIAQLEELSRRADAISGSAWPMTRKTGGCCRR